MAIVSLTDAQSRADFFHRTVLANLQYWQAWLEGRLADVAVLDRERQGILRAISFALDLDQLAWPAVQDLIRSFSPYMERRGHWDSWNRILGRAIKTAQGGDDLAREVVLTTLLARLLFQQGRFQEAVSSYRRTIRLARQMGDRFNEGRACTNLGYFYAERGQWYRAEILCCHALDLFEQINNDHGLAHTENHLGFLYTRQGVWDKAEQHLEQACTLWQAMKDSHGLMRGSINLGALYIESEQPDKAIFYLERALEQAERTGSEPEIGKVYLNIGSAYRLKGDPVQAESYAREAEKVFKRFSNRADLARTWANLGLACVDQEKWAEAYRYLEASLEARRKLNDRYGEIKSLLHLLEYELARGNQAGAMLQFNEVGQRIHPRRQSELYRHLHLLLARYQLTLVPKKASEVLSSPET